MRPFISRRSAVRTGSQIFRSSVQRPWQAGRCYSAKAELQELDSSKLVVEKTTTPGALKKSDELIFGATFTGQTPITLSA